MKRSSRATAPDSRRGAALRAAYLTFGSSGKCAPAPLFSYLAAGRPSLAVADGNPHPEEADVVVVKQVPVLRVGVLHVVDGEP